MFADKLTTAEQTAGSSKQLQGNIWSSTLLAINIIYLICSHVWASGSLLLVGWFYTVFPYIISPSSTPHFKILFSKAVVVMIKFIKQIHIKLLTVNLFIYYPFALLLYNNVTSTTFAPRCKVK